MKLPLNLSLRKMAVIGSASSNFKIMWSLKPTNKKPIEVKQIVFDNVAGIFDYPKNIRIPNVGEYVWFSVWKREKDGRGNVRKPRISSIFFGGDC